MMTTYKSVFVSSTYMDLVEYRTAAIRVLRQAGFVPAVMEDNPALAFTTLEASLTGVRQADLFIGIYAWRYGTIPDGYSKSITELEWIEAHRLSKPVLCFCSQSMKYSPTEFIDRGEKASLLEQFKHEIATKYTIEEFSDVASLCEAILTSLHRLGKGGDQSKKLYKLLHAGDFVTVEKLSLNMLSEDSLNAEIRLINCLALMRGRYCSDLDRGSIERIEENLRLAIQDDKWRVTALIVLWVVKFEYYHNRPVKLNESFPTLRDVEKALLQSIDRLFMEHVINLLKMTPKSNHFVQQFRMGKLGH